jgi:hypothetical protein
VTWLVALLFAIATPTQVCGTDVVGSPIPCQEGQTPPTTVVYNVKPYKPNEPTLSPPVEGSPIGVKPSTPAPAGMVTAAVRATRQPQQGVQK